MTCLTTEHAGASQHAHHGMKGDRFLTETTKSIHVCNAPRATRTAHFSCGRDSLWAKKGVFCQSGRRMHTSERTVRRVDDKIQQSAILSFVSSSFKQKQRRFRPPCIKHAISHTGLTPTLHGQRTNHPCPIRIHHSSPHQEGYLFTGLTRRSPARPPAHPHATGTYTNNRHPGPDCAKKEEGRASADTSGGW